MKTVNPFDTMIEHQKKIPSDIRTAAIELTDTLDLCWAAARAVFEKQAKPEHALALLPMFMQRSDAKRQQAEDEYKKYADDATAPAVKKTVRRQPPKAS